MDPIEVGGIGALAGLAVAGAFKLAERAMARKNGTGCKADVLGPALQDLRVVVAELRMAVDNLGSTMGGLATAFNEVQVKLAVIEDRLPKRRAGK